MVKPDVTHRVFYDQPVEEDLGPGKSRKVTHLTIGKNLGWDITAAEIRDWFDVPDPDTGEITPQASSGAIIRMDDVPELIDALQKAYDYDMKRRGAA